MRELEYVIDNYKSQTLTGRDLTRLMDFVPESDLSKIGVELKEEYVDKYEHKAWDRELIIEQLKKDVDFGFEKALDCRGISSGEMHEVVKMWNWILEEGLEDMDTYAQYGLPTLKATALKYGFDNPIGDDSGSEKKYEEEY